MAGIVTWPTGLVTGCGESKYPLQEKEAEGVVRSNSGWDTFEGLTLDLINNDGKIVTTLCFRGSPADTLLAEFEDFFRANGVEVE
jgi:hypothetical protein